MSNAKIKSAETVQTKGQYGVRLPQEWARELEIYAKEEVLSPTTLAGSIIVKFLRSRREGHLDQSAAVEG